jgi:predicted methyltransferase
VDVYRDDRRKPAETVAFAGVAPGMTVAELIPGNGYYTRILSKAVGPQGHVYTLPFSEPRASYSKAIAADPAYANVTLVTGPPLSLNVPAPVDVVWTTQNYHDIRQGRALLNKAVFAALKPGGTYFVVDHAAVAGAGEDVLLSLHRIDEATVKREVLAAGFVLDAESDLLRNPADKRTQMVFDREVNRSTDQFVLKFRKPAK